MGLVKIINGKRYELSKRFNFNLSIERLLYEEEYRTIYENEDPTANKFNLISGMRLDGIMSPVILSFYHEDFLLLMRCIFFNITYDDLQDKLFLSNYVDLPQQASIPAGGKNSILLLIFIS